MVRVAISIERVEFNTDNDTITVYERQDRTCPIFDTGSPSFQSFDRLRTGSATYTIMEFMALLAGHIPFPYESMIYYYGLYSSSHRGKEKREW